MKHEQTNFQGGSSIEESVISDNVPLVEDEGIIEVVKQSVEEEEDEELKLLRSLKTFEPFIKESDKGFSIESLLGMKSNSKPSVSPLIMQDREALVDPMLDVLFTLQTYIKENMSHLNMEQRMLFKRITYVNELSSTCNTIMINAHSQAKLAAEKMTEIAALKEQALKVNENATQLFKSLSSLEKYLDPEDRIAVNADPTLLWPILNDIRAQALKSTEHPSIERYISSSSELTTVGTSTSPLLEKIIVTGEPVKDDENLPDTSQKSASNSTTSSSLALDKLRGLSTFLSLQKKK